MLDPKDLLSKNRRWAEHIKSLDPHFFEKLSHQQRPEFLWIGCSDSRVPANEITGLLPGEVFVHRNVANLVFHTDLNVLSVMEYAVRVLQVRHIIVCGHYGCGGVRTACENADHGLIDNWLRHIRDVHRQHWDDLAHLEDDEARIDRLCEINVAAQVRNVCNTTVVQQAWERNQPLAVHGWIYSIQDGLIRNLHVTTRSNEDVPAIEQRCLELARASGPAPTEAD